MSLRINTNVSAFNAHRTLTGTSNALQKSMQKLSSGYRINSAADDAAGLGISERMRGQIRGLDQAQRNVQDGISFVQTAEGSMQELHSILHRARELAVQYNNSIGGSDARTAIHTEIKELYAEADRLVGAAKFNNIPLLSGANNTVSLQVGANTSDTVLVTLPNITNTGATGGLNGLSLFATGAAPASVNIDLLDNDINALATHRGQLGALQNRLESTANAIAVQQENLMAAESRIRDVDMAKEMAQLSRMQILQQSGTAMLAQANMSGQNVLSLLQG